MTIFLSFLAVLAVIGLILFGFSGIKHPESSSSGTEPDDEEVLADGDDDTLPY